MLHMEINFFLSGQTYVPCNFLFATFCVNNMSNANYIYNILCHRGTISKRISKSKFNNKVFKPLQRADEDSSLLQSNGRSSDADGEPFAREFSSQLRTAA